MVTAVVKRERCRSTGKVSFPTYQQAADRLLVIMLSPTGSAYRPVRVTDRCHSCDGYHLTSKSGKPWRSGKQTTARRRKKRG